MFKLDPFSLVVTNALLSLVLTTVLLLSRFGLGSSASGIRTWVAGDLMMGLARVLILFEVMNPGFTRTSALAFPTASGTLTLVGIVSHYFALRRMSEKTSSNLRTLAASLAAGASFGVMALLLPNAGVRVHLLDALIGAMSLLTLHACLPIRRFWGSRVIGAMMLFAVTLMSLRTGAFVLGLESARGQLDLHGADGGVHLLTELIISLFVTTGYAMLVQERVRERIERLVVTDALTGVLNRHGLMAPMQREMAQADRSGRPLAVVLFDLDHFKRVNDEHGHGVGDSVLAGFAGLAGTLTREGDLFGRWGGEEFLLLLPDTAEADALRVAERIRARVACAPLARGAPNVTVSGGVASALEVHGTVNPLLKMLELADQRLYLAKDGRNRIVGAAPGAADEPREPAPHRRGMAADRREAAETAGPG